MSPERKRRPNRAQQRVTKLPPLLYSLLHKKRCTYQRGGGEWKVVLMINPDTNSARCALTRYPLAYALSFSLFKREVWNAVFAVNGMTRSKAALFLAAVGRDGRADHSMARYLQAYIAHRQRHRLGLWYTCGESDKSYELVRNWCNDGCRNGSVYMPRAS